MSKTTQWPRHKALVAFLVEKRERAGLTQTDLARKLGQHQSFVARLESGQRRIDVVELLDIAEAIDFDPREAVRRVLAANRQ
jgi:transcriptional regulator with XRE-family HTH domain